jgi:hypothetical protein
VISGGASKHRPRFFFLGARRWRREHYKARRRRRRGPVRLLLLQPRLRPAEPPSSSSLAPTRASQPKPPRARIGFRFPISPRRAPAAGTPIYSLSIQESSGSKMFTSTIFSSFLLSQYDLAQHACLFQCSRVRLRREVNHLPFHFGVYVFFIMRGLFMFG